MRTCSTCIPWNEGQYHWLNEDCMQCTSEKLVEEQAEGQDDCLVYDYSEGGSFYTGPNFGCIHHEKKEDIESFQTVSKKLTVFVESA